MIYSRWLSLAVFAILLLFIAFYDKNNRGIKAKKYSKAFIEGMIGGIIIDSIGVNAGYYYFPRQEIYSLSYFAIVVPCWGVFGLLINCIWQWIGKEVFTRGLLVTLIPLFAFYEGTNLIAGSWVYTVPFHVVALGWIPLILVFAGCNRRRRVVFKLKMLKEQYSGNQAITVCLNVLLGLTTVVMFPLLIMSIIKMLHELPKLREAHFTHREYMEYLMIAGV